MGIVVKDPGILTTIQDAGRYGYQQFGVSPSGPMDMKSFYQANILVGNTREEGALEMTFVGPTLMFSKGNVIAITGGDLSPMLNGQRIPMCAAVAVETGDTLSFGMGGADGCRAYLAFAGGLDIPMVMGSKSTLMRNNLGGYKGRKLEKGDRITFLQPKENLPFIEKRRIAKQVFPKKDVVLRVITGPQDSKFEEEERKRFFWYGAEITNEFDRMGCRLKRHEPMKFRTDGHIITDGISFGSIQVPPDGQPIIMLADRQSTGGYAKIGTVISVDLPKIAQSIPGYRIRFVQVSIELAQQLLVRQIQELSDLETQLNELKWRN